MLRQTVRFLRKLSKRNCNLKFIPAALPKRDFEETLCRHYSTIVDKKALQAIRAGKELESYITKLDSLPLVLDLVEGHKDVLELPLICLTLERISSFLKGMSEEDLISLQQNSAYIELQERLLASLGDITPEGIIQVLSWMQSCRNANAPIRLPRASAFPALEAAILLHERQGKLNFEKLIDIWYRLVSVRYFSDPLVKIVSERLHLEREKIEPKESLQVWRCLTHNRKFFTGAESAFAWDLASRMNLKEKVGISVATELFFHMANPQFNLRPPNFRFPDALFAIAQHIRAGVDQMSESDVLRVVEAYDLLGQEFPFDLFDRIRNSILALLKTNPKAFRSPFVVRLLAALVRMKRYSYLETGTITAVSAEIARRLKSDEEDVDLLQFTTLLKLCEIVLEHAHLSLGLTQPLHQLIQNSPIPKDVSPGRYLPFLELFIHQKLSHKALLDQIAARSEEMSFAEKLMFVCLRELSSDPTHLKDLAEYVKEPQNILEAVHELHRHKFPSKSRSELLDAASSFLRQKQIEQLDGANSESQGEGRLLELFLFTVHDTESRMRWFDHFSKEVFAKRKHFLKPEDVNQITKVLAELSHPFADHVLLVLQLFQSSFEIVGVSFAAEAPISNFVDRIATNPQIIYRIISHEKLFRVLFEVIDTFFKAAPTSMRLLPLLSLIRTLGVKGFQTQTMYKSLANAFSLSHSNENLGVSNHILLTIAQLLIPKGLMNLTHAAKIYTQVQETLENPLLRIRFLAPLVRAGLTQFNSELVKNEGLLRAKLMASSDPNEILKIIAHLLLVPYDHIKAHLPRYHDLLAASIPKTNVRNFLELLEALPEDHKAFAAFYKTISEGYATVRQLRLYLTDYMRILECVGRLKLKNPKLINPFFEDFERIASNLPSTSRREALEHVVAVSYKRNQLIDQLLARFFEEPTRLNRNTRWMIGLLFNIAYDSPAFAEAFEKLIKEFPRDIEITSPYLLHDTLAMIPILRYMDEHHHLSVLLAQGNKSFTSQRVYTGPKTFNLYEYLRIAYPNDKFAEALRSGNEHFETEYAKYQSTSIGVNMRYRVLIGRYCEVMGNAFESGKKIEGLIVDIYLPATKTIVKLWGSLDFNYDMKTLRGLATLESLTLHKLVRAGYRVVEVDLTQFLHTKTHQARVNLLAKAGVTLDKGRKPDFSKLSDVKLHSSEPERGSKSRWGKAVETVS